MNDYVDKDGVVHTNIVLLMEDTKDCTKGWHFRTPYEDLEGPFDTLEECKRQYEAFCFMLGGRS